MPAIPGHLIAVLAAVGLCGCTVPPQSHGPAFQVPAGLSLTITPNDRSKQPMVFQADVLDHLIRERWSSESAAVLRQSHLSENAKYSALALRAFQAVGGSDCKNLRLLGISAGQTSAPGASSSTEAAELWEIDACGQREKMPVAG